MNPLYMLAAKATGGLLIVLVLWHFWASYGRMEEALEEARADLAVATVLAKDTAHRTELNTTLDKDVTAARTRTTTATKELISEIPSRIPADACALPPGWRVQHDLAASGVPSDPGAPGAADATPVSPQEAAAVVTDNYGQYHQLAEQLAGLQRYVKEQCHGTPTE